MDQIFKALVIRFLIAAGRVIPGPGPGLAQLTAWLEEAYDEFLDLDPLTGLDLGPSPLWEPSLAPNLDLSDPKPEPKPSSKLGLGLGPGPGP